MRLIRAASKRLGRQYGGRGCHELRFDFWIRAGTQMKTIERGEERARGESERGESERGEKRREEKRREEKRREASESESESESERERERERH